MRDRAHLPNLNPKPQVYEDFILHALRKDLAVKVRERPFPAVRAPQGRMDVASRVVLS